MRMEEEKKRRKRVYGSNVFDSLAVTMVQRSTPMGLAEGGGESFQEERIFLDEVIDTVLLKACVHKHAHR